VRSLSVLQKPRPVRRESVAASPGIRRMVSPLRALASRRWRVFAVVVAILPMMHIELIEHHSQDLGPRTGQACARFADDLLWGALRIGHPDYPVHHRRQEHSITG